VIISYSRVDSAALVPQRANPSDAGADIFACLSDPVTVYPGENEVISTGIKIEIPHGYMIQVMNRSSIASKRGLLVGAHVIDAGYEGEILINLHNVTETPQEITHGSKIAQLVMIPVIQFRLTEEDEEDLYFEDIVISDRQEGGFGSTDT
jgi:dUTP pyrophosphatase